MMNHFAPLALLLLACAAAGCGARSSVIDEEAAGGGGGATTGTDTTGTNTTGTTGTNTTGTTGTLTTTPTGPAPLPFALYVRNEQACPEEHPATEALTTLSTAGTTDETVVVEVAFAAECTGAGGDYVLAREVGSTGEMWIGEHACWVFDSWPPPEGIYFGVARYSQTAALFSIPEGVCVTFPGELEPPTSDVIARAIAVFSSLDEAFAFEALLP
ncbi:MAG: hypothetical protein R3B70_02890 [Polyangiaceae bacterium]